MNFLMAASDAFRPLRRSEYERLVELGAFGDDRLELLRGVLCLMSPQGSRHASIIQVLNRSLLGPLAGRAEVRIQMPLALSDDSEPEPDLAIVPPGDYWDGHPTTAHLIVEVAESRPERDRLKLALYAEAGLPEVWLIDVGARAVEVHREPDGGHYGELRTLRPGDTLAVAAFPDVTLPVSALMPAEPPAKRREGSF